MKAILVFSLCFNLLNTKAQYESFQGIGSEYMYYSLSFALTDNSSRIVYATGTPTVLVYGKFVNNFNIEQTINEQSAGRIFNVDLSGDGLWLVTIDEQGVAYVYKHFYINFQRTQILPTTKHYNQIKISRDYWIACLSTDPCGC